MRDIPNYEKKYAIDEQGNVWSYKHKKFLKPVENNGYYGVSLVDSNNKVKRWQIHRLVALTYLPNENNLPYINHKDENKLNNSVDNLEWCTPYYNIHYGSCIDKIKKSRTKELMEKCHKAAGIALSKAVLCIETGIVYPSIKKAEETIGSRKSHIGDCCNGKRNVACGYHWQYALEE